MQPWLKNKKEGGTNAGPDDVQRVKTEDQDMDMLDAVAHDILTAVAAKDHRLLRQALESLVEHIQSEDEIQDNQEQEG